jgi:hypothetical protein
VVQRPSGLKLVDTRTWTIRPLDPAAANASWQAARLLAYGRMWDGEAERERGIGVTLHGPGGRRQHLLGNRAVGEAHLNGDLLYASVDNGGGQPGRVVVSLRSGQMVASSDELLPYLLDDPRPPAEGQALFSAALVVELELPPSEDEVLEDELESASFLALSAPSVLPSALPGAEDRPRESVR